MPQLSSSSQTTDKDRIEQLLRNPQPGEIVDQWPPCRICAAQFNRNRPTLRYCRSCEKAYCEGEHGGYGAAALCLACIFKSIWGTPLG